MHTLRTFVALGALSGCFSPKFPEGLSCGTGDEPCPPGQVCDNGVCRTMAGPPPVDVPVDPSDLDGDGIQNDNDNCPEHFNPGQYDEDFDIAGNECDPCPFTPANTDRDGDGVGDACDPFPDKIGETIVLFEGFDEPVAAGWLLFGNWAQGGGELAFQLQNGELAYAHPPISTDGTGVLSGAFVADLVDPAFVDRGIGVGWIDGNQGVGLACTAAVAPDQTRILAAVDHTTFQPIAFTPAQWGNGTLEIVSHTRRDMANHECGLTGSFSTAIQTTFMGAVPMMLGIGARSVTGRYLWVMYVDSPSGPNVPP